MNIAYRMDRGDLQVMDYKDPSISKLLSSKEIMGFADESGLAPGLYRYFNIDKKKLAQRLILHSDFKKNFENICLIFSWGSKHNRLPIFFKNKILKRQNLILTCGYITDFLIHHLSVYFTDLKFRKVSFLTLEQKNGYLDGHTLMEVYYEGKWRLFDFSRANLFVDNNQELLNALDLMVNPSFEILNLSEFRFDLNHTYHGKSSNIIEFYWATKQGQKDFYNRVIGGQVLENTNQQLICIKNDRPLPKEYKHLVKMTISDFKHKFYNS